jgi:hypothetical protein
MRIILATTLPALLLCALALCLPVLPAGMALGAAIAAPLLALGAGATVGGLGSLRDPVANGFGRALAGAGAGFTLRITGALVAAVSLGHDLPARIAIATIAGCLFVGTLVETVLLLRVLQRALPVRESAHA